MLIYEGMSRQKGQCTAEQRAVTIMGEGSAPIEPMQQYLPEHLRLAKDESHQEYLERVAPSFIEWLMGEAMLEKNPMAIASVTKLLEKKMDSQVKLEQITNRSGKVRQILSGTAGAVREAAGVSRLGDVMAGKMRPSDVGRAP